MSDFKQVIKDTAQYLEDSDKFAHVLWTWLPSYFAAEQGHGHCARDYVPSPAEVMKEACAVIRFLVDQSTSSKWALQSYAQCPCGECQEDTDIPHNWLSKLRPHE